MFSLGFWSFCDKTNNELFQVVKKYATLEEAQDARPFWVNGGDKSLTWKIATVQELQAYKNQGKYFGNV